MPRPKRKAEPAAIPERDTLKAEVERVVDDFPARLRAFRVSLGLSQQRFAELIGVDETTAYRLERGSFLPSFYTFAAILLLGFPAPDLDDESDRPITVFEERLSPLADADETDLWSSMKQ